MKDFKKTLIALIDNGSSKAKSLIESFNDVVDSFDMDAQLDYFNEKKKELIKKGNDLLGDFSELMKQIKESITDFSVTVPYDKSSGEKISYEVKDGKLNIEVTYNDETSVRCNTTSVLIPANCDLEKVNFDINETLKIATVTIPKKVVEPNKEETVAKKPTKKRVSKKSCKKEPVAQEINDDTSHLTEKLAEKLSQNGNKYANMMKRDSSGRFVRRTPKNN